MSDLKIRLAKESDATELLDIYAPYVKNTSYTFEYEVPSVEEFAGRIKNTLSLYPYLVAELDGRIVGYTYAARFRERRAYDWAAETSIYVREDVHRRGVGRLLFTELERLLRLQNVTTLCACISYPNKNSIKFHSNQDFERVARFSHCAFKHGKWIDVIYMQKFFADSADAPLPFIPFSELAGSTGNV